MQLALSDACPLFKPEHREQQLRVLTSVVYHKRHNLLAPLPSRLQEILHPDLKAIFLEPLRQGLKLSATTSGPPLQFLPDCSSCDPEKLASYLELDLKLVLENAGTDGKYLRLVLGLLRPSLRSRLDPAKGYIDVRQAGGITEVAKEVGRVMDGRRSRLLADLPTRVIAVIDSDSPRPGSPTLQAKQAADDVLAQGVPVHVLAMRSIENYVPDEALLIYVAARADRAPAAAVVAKLKTVERDHYPMKSGLSAKERDAPDSVFGATLELSLGLGDFVTDLVDNFAHAVRADDLLRRDAGGDLMRLLQLIEENL